MAARPDVYHARKRGKRGFWRLMLGILLVLILVAALLFISCQKYIVYENNGLRVVFPFMREATAAEVDAPTPTIYPAELQYDEPDYSSLLTNAGQGLEIVHGRYLTASSVTEDRLNTVSNTLSSTGVDTLVLQMKSPSGFLSWKSGVVMADAFEVNGSEDLSEVFMNLKDKGVHLVAVVSCCVDSAMAERYEALALRTSDGSPYEDSNGGWMDPYNSVVRDYLSGLCRELARMGFEEIILSYLQMPNTSAEFDFSAELSTTPTPTDAVTSLGRSLRTALSGENVKLSMFVSSDSILYDLSSRTGQDLGIMTKLCDRICVFTDSASIPTITENITNANSDFDIETRFIPFVTNSQVEGSWVLTS